MSELNSIANSRIAKAYQASIPKEVRVARARELALLKWKKISAADRRVHALKMVKARQTKIVLPNTDNTKKIPHG